MVKNSLSDNAIAKRVLSGDKDAFGLWVDKYSDAVFAIAIGHTRNHDEALELTQEIFLRAYQRLDEVTDFALFGHWLNKVASNMALNAIRIHDGKRVAAFSEISSSDPDAGQPDFQAAADSFGGDRELVIRALAELPEKLRTIILMKYVDEYSYTKIAEELRLSIATVRTRIARAKELLKASLDKAPSQQSATA